MSTQMMKTVTNNPIKSAVATIISIASIVTFFWAVDSHYVSAADFSQYQRSQEKFQHQQQQGFKDYQRRELDNKIFELQFKVNEGSASNLEKAQLDRYKRQRRDLQ